MRYRTLDADGDMTFGQGSLNFLVDSPEAVGQAVLTRMRLEAGEWFLDVTEGVDYQRKILGFGTEQSRDVEIRARILGTRGVVEIAEFSSAVTVDRRYSVAALINSLYGAVDLSQVAFATIVPSLDFQKPGNAVYIAGL